MTNREAIETLNLHNPFMSNNTILSEAMDMAVKSLENSNSVAISTLEELLKEIDDIDEPDHDFEGFYRCQNEVLEIIDKHISELKGEQK